MGSVAWPDPDTDVVTGVGGGEGEALNVTLCVLWAPGVVGGAAALDLLVADMASARLNVLREVSSLDWKVVAILRA